ncbi:MAG: hypothetical protein AMXMBFR42_15930 [Burkholderiales bacterium]
MRLACGDPLEERAGIRDRDDGQRQAALARETLDQFVVEPLWLAVRPGKPAPRARAHGNDERLRHVRRREFGDAASGDERGDRERRRRSGEARRIVQRSQVRGKSHRAWGGARSQYSDPGRAKPRARPERL